MKITQDLTKVNASSRNGEAIIYIVVHETGNKTDTAKANANYFREVNRNASAHYFVDADGAVQVVLDNRAAWHCGDGAARFGISNQNSIGIEMCKENGGVNAGTVKNTLELIASLMEKYNVPLERIVRHYDASRKICPAAWSGNGWARWYVFKEQLENLIKKGSDEVTEERIREIIKEEISAPSAKGEGFNSDHWAYPELCELNTFFAEKGVEGITETRLDDSVNRGEMFRVANLIVKALSK